jgi:NAD(P)-dependent dehydrogenase (short-subunit alcohol dehydrogenase family)
MMEAATPERPIALVTGGGGYIGRAIARRLALTSSAVAIVDLDEQRGVETAYLVEEAGCKAKFIRADVSSSEETSGFVEEVERTFGPIAIFAQRRHRRRGRAHP